MDKFDMAESWISWYDRQTEVYVGHIVLHDIDKNTLRLILRIDPDDDFELDAYECIPEERVLIEDMTGISTDFAKYSYFFEFGMAFEQ